MSEWIDIQKDARHVARERARARELRRSGWWQRQIAGGVCHYCGKQVGAQALTLDHIVPVARGGVSTKGNVVPACHACNASKRCLTPAEQILAQLELEEAGEESAREASDESVARAETLGKRLVIASPHGFCSGVARAVKAAEAALAEHPDEKVHCLNEIVHNQQVVGGLRARGMLFVKSVEEVPVGGVLLLSAHGVAPEVVRRATERRLRVVDATCPFVMKIHAEVRRFAAAGACVICIGHRGHDEVIGVVGEAPEHVRVVENAAEAEALTLPAGAPVAVVTQTTLGAEQVDNVMAVLRRRFPDIWLSAAADVCYATRNRQEAVRALARVCPVILVLGAANSSNTQRLAETARAAGARAELVSELGQLEGLDLREVFSLGLTSGASTPEEFLDEVVAVLRARFGFPVPELLASVAESSPEFNIPRTRSLG